LIAPCHEDAARAPVGQRGEGKVAELLLDYPDVLDVVGACALGAAGVDFMLRNMRDKAGCPK
jgi:hypothetical protein